jgi:hypothetical protein
VTPRSRVMASYCVRPGSLCVTPEPPSRIFDDVGRPPKRADVADPGDGVAVPDDSKGVVAVRLEGAMRLAGRMGLRGSRAHSCRWTCRNS